MSNHWIEQADLQDIREALATADDIYAAYEVGIKELADEAAKNFLEELVPSVHKNKPAESISRSWQMAARNAISCAMRTNPDKDGVWTSNFDNAGWIASVRVLRRHAQLDQPGHPYKVGIGFHYALAGGFMG